MSINFPGKDLLIERIRWATRGQCPKDITNCLRDALCDLIAEPSIKLPAELLTNDTDGYKRTQLYHDEKTGCVVMAMTWAPGQGTVIHDHSGMWCVEGIWHGSIEVVQYELTDQQSERYHFEQRTTMRAGRGSAGSLIPPHEYHTIRNANSEETAVSIHIYSGEMTSCNVFTEEEGGWYRREPRQLSCN